MSDQYLLAMAERLARCVESGVRETRGPFAELTTERYLSDARWQAERAHLFRRYPLIAARSADLPSGGHWQALNIAGCSLLLTRSEDGRAHAYLNACRHRGMQLLNEGQQHCKHSLSCPYHGWTYGAQGNLRGLPHQDAFPGLDLAANGLIELPSAERHGFVWVQPEPGDQVLDIAAWLHGVDDDLQHFGLAEHVVFAEGKSTVKANWKLCIDAFLEAYHVRVLHRNTVGPFFEDALAVSDHEGLHFRSGVARKGLREDENAALRDAVSFTHFVFPNQVFVFHPDYVSQMSILPSSAREFAWHHRMLIPASQNTEALREHWQKSFELIEGGVFQSEDLHASEQIQRGLETGANATIRLGQLETLVRDFHAHLDAELAAAADPSISRPASQGDGRRGAA